jgi:hypothetical protein
MREVFFQDEDVLITYDTQMADAAGPDGMVNRLLHTGDLRPPAWFWTFGNLRPRPAGRGLPTGVLAALRATSPALRFTTTTTPAAGVAGTTSTAVSARLAERFELLVGLAQRRFFDRPCAVAMARTLHDVLVAFLDTPGLHPGRVWMLGNRATVGREMLLVDRDFTIDGQTSVWRLGADLTDRDARAWVLGMLTDCAAKVVTAYATGSPTLLLDMDSITPPAVDPALPQALAQRTTALAARTTLAGFLAHRRAHLGLSVAQVAEAALLPEPVIAGWEVGAEAAPTQLLRCAPVLQLPEDTLLHAGDGLREAGYWPLPSPAARAES